MVGRCCDVLDDQHPLSAVGLPYYRKNWEDPEYASKGKRVRLEEKLLQLVIIFRMIATQAQNFFPFSSSVSSKGG